ncbi:hypothetical protein [Sinorhizobium meliloti]|uniref:hypothetical protein n=1 Tax=Rhizobium meliloti TaxID=382 RepID=UPI0013E3CA6E|nr:hypothetical protein [Sinorhizobium meliloti]
MEIIIVAVVVIAAVLIAIRKQKRRRIRLEAARLGYIHADETFEEWRARTGQ